MDPRRLQRIQNEMNPLNGIGASNGYLRIETVTVTVLTLCVLALCVLAFYIRVIL